MKYTFLFLLAALTLTGCEEEIQNGIIPEKYIAAAKKYEGVFHGSFADHELQLKVEIKENGYVLASAIDSQNQTDLIQGCNSKIGQLQSVKIDESSSAIDYIYFQLDNDCNITGKKVYFYFLNENQLKLRVEKSGYRSAYGGSKRDRYRWIVTEWLEGVFTPTQH